MLKALRSDKPSFNSVTFKKGLNIILGDTKKIDDEGLDEERKKSLNGVGKSTLIEIINFCLASEFKIGEKEEEKKQEKEKVLVQAELKGWTFILDIEINGKDYSVHRNTEQPDIILIEGDCSNWRIKPKVDSKTGHNHYKYDEWRLILGDLFFDLPINEPLYIHYPSFRALFGYFARSNVKAYISPFENFSPLDSWLKQEQCLYLLGLDWEYPAKIHDLDKQKKELNKLQNDLKRIQELSKSALGTEVLVKLKELKHIKQQLTHKVNTYKTNLENFQVHEQYKEIEDEVNTLTGHLHTISNENFKLKKVVTLYKKGLEAEKISSDESLVGMYAEAGIVLPELVTKRLEDVLEFHNKVISNRSSFLKNEIHKKELEISNNDSRINVLEGQRSSLLKILHTHGTLDEFKRLNEHYSKVVSQLEDVNRQIQLYTDISKQKTQIKTKTTQLTQHAYEDFTEQEQEIESINSIFQSYWLSLYQEPASLSIELDVEANQYKFDFIGEKMLSDGYRHMRIFCFDLLLATLGSNKTNKIDYLIHDTIVFSEVFNSQIALAIELAKKISEKNNFQYIFTMNDDKVPYELFSEGFDFRSHVVKILTNDDNGGLLGIRF